MISSVVLDAFVVEFMMNFIRSREAGCLADMLAMAREICEELIDIGGLDSEATHLFRFPVELWSGSDYEASVLTCVAAGMRRAGQPFGISEESDRIFQVIAPKSGALENTSGAAADFGFHTDNAALPPQFHPQSIALTCMHNDAHAETGVVSVDEIFNRLAPPLRAVAAQSRFRHVMPPSFGEACVGQCEPRPLFYERGGRLRCAMATYRTVPATAGDVMALRVLEAIREVAVERAVWIDLQPGDLLFFRNDSVLHGRREIKGRRRLLRSYWRRSLAEFRLCASTTEPHVFSAISAMRTGMPSWP